MSFHYSSQQPSLNDGVEASDDSPRIQAQQFQQPLDNGLYRDQINQQQQPPPPPPQQQQQHQQQQQPNNFLPPLQQHSRSNSLHQYQQQAHNHVQTQQHQHQQAQVQNSPKFSQEINWNGSYRQNQIPNVNLTPRLSNAADYTSPYGTQQNQKSPYGSPTNQFKNPWYSQKSPNLNTQQLHQQTQVAPILQQTPTRATNFNNQLPTTYEYENMSPEIAKKRFVVLPPSRVPAPAPDFADATVELNTEPQRRQSVANFHTRSSNNNNNQIDNEKGNNQLNYQQAQYYNLSRRQSYLQNPQLKQLPPPTIRKVSNKNELKPLINQVPKYRRASMASNYISPLLSLTTELATTYSLCNPEFHYEISKNPKRVLTKPSEGVTNSGYDNVENDYILFVNDVLGVQENRKYLVLDILGKGTFAQVVKCQNLHTKELVAVKVVKSKPAYINQSLSEISLLELINKKIDPLDEHHFLRLKDKFIHKSHLCLVFELLSSNLFELIKQNQYKGLSTKLVRNFAHQLLDSLCVLKQSKIIHCDLKPENILLISPDKPDIKVVDFGSACQERQTLYTYIQSRFYRCPEVLLGLPYTTSIDTWSLGCIIAELFLGLPLFPGSSEYDQFSKITAVLGLPPTWMIDMSKNGKSFVEKDESTGLYSLKSIDRYNRDRNTVEEPGKKYFGTDNLDELIKNYTMNKKSMTSTMIEKEKRDRESLVHLLRGLLNLNPLERWTPQQAILHPFIVDSKFTGSWSPPGTDFKSRKKDEELNHVIKFLETRGEV